MKSNNIIIVCSAIMGLFVATLHSSSRADTATSPADSGMVLRGGEDGTVFKSLTIEGEDLVHVEFERPILNLDIDPTRAPGLDWGDLREIVDRNELDMVSKLHTLSALQRTPYRPRPWLNLFASGAVARFRPEVEGVDRWCLSVADSRGRSVVAFQGNGKPPKEIAWNGLSSDGVPALPGFVYSHAFEATDRAGNKRNFLGEGFELPPYRVETAGNLMLLFSARDLTKPNQTSSPSTGRTPAILLEAATWLNQRGLPDQPIYVEVTARSFDQSIAIAEKVVGTLKPLVVGDPIRIQAITKVEPDAPDEGTIRITATLWPTE